jgi:hypothetical protein
MTGQARWYPVLRTSRDEIAETCRDPRYADVLSFETGEALAARVEAASERLVGQIARRAGELIMEGAEYWPALVVAAERVLTAR